MRTIPDPGFAGDDGTAAASVVAALTAYAADPEGRYLATVAVLQDTRLLVPVVATADDVEVDEDGRAHEKTSDMAAVHLRGRDGRLALLAFSSTEQLRAWNPEARPVPVTTRDAARAALQDQASALLLDIAGPARLLIGTPELTALAAGHRLAPLHDTWAWTRPLSESG